MRYYNVLITDQTSGKLLQQFTNYLNGQIDLGALDLELDLPVAATDGAPITQGGFLRFWGVSLGQISQAIGAE